MGNYTYRFNPISGEFDIVQDLSLIHIKDPVDTYNDLPIIGNAENDARFVKDTDILYVWTIASASGSLSDWKETAKMSIANLDALDDGSVYGRVKLTELEEGQVKRLDDGTNEVSALDAKDAVDKKHDKLHEINSISNHLGISGSGIEDNFMAIDSNGLPKNSEKSASDFANASHNHTEGDITDLDHYDSADFATDFGLADLANLGTKSYNDLTDKPDLSDLHYHDNKVELDLVTDGNHDIRTDNPHVVTVDQLDLASGTVASDVDDAVSKKHPQNTDIALRTDKLTVDTNGHTTIVGELKIKVFAQASEPTLNADEYMAIWKDTGEDNRVYLLFRRGIGDQVAVELA